MSRGKNDDSTLDQNNQAQGLAVVNPAEVNTNMVVAEGVGESVNFKDTFRTALATSEPPAVDGANNRNSLPRIIKNNHSNTND